MLDCKITRKEFQEALRELKSNKAPGPEGILNEHLRNLPVLAQEQLLDIFNNTLDNETITLDWPDSTITNLYKKGDAEDPAYYRPIALLNNTMKLFILQY